MHRAAKHLTELETEFPNCFKKMGWFLSSEFKARASWPSYCFLPIAAGISVVTHGSREPQSMLMQNPSLIGKASQLTGLSAWRITKGVYRFDVDWFEHVSQADLSQKIPWEMLFSMPEWCVYIETHNVQIFDQHVFGFFAWLEFDIKTSKTELRFLLDTENGLITLLLPKADTIEHGLNQIVGLGQNGTSGPVRVLDKTTPVGSVRHLEHNGTSGPVRLNQDPEFVQAMQQLVALVLYLCVDKPDIHSMTKSAMKPTMVATKRGEKMFAARAETIFEIGYARGQDLRTAQSQHNDSPHHGVRPHVRRAHFHTYLVGKGRTQSKLVFLSPILVNTETVIDASN